MARVVGCKEEKGNTGGKWDLPLKTPYVSAMEVWV